MKKTFKVSTEIEYLNIDEILAHYKEPKFWKKSWNIFKVKDFNVTWKMKQIDVENNTINSAVYLKYHGKHNIKEYIWSVSSEICAYCQSIPIDHSDYSQQTFIRNVLGTVIRCIDTLETRIIKNSYEYKEACRLEEDEKDKLREIAEQFLDSEHVTNDDIREAYIDSYISHAKTVDYTGRIINTASRKYYPTVRLIAYSWFNNKKKFDEESEIVRNIKKTKKKFIYEIWNARKQLNSEEYLKEAEEQLEAL